MYGTCLRQKPAITVQTNGKVNISNQVSVVHTRRICVFRRSHLRAHVASGGTMYMYVQLDLHLPDHAPFVKIKGYMQPTLHVHLAKENAHVSKSGCPYEVLIDGIHS